MGFGDASIFLIVAFILLIIALVIQILGVALPYWILTETSVSKSYYGLWKVCTEINDDTACGTFKSSQLDDWYKAVRAFEIIGLLLIVAALIVTIVVLFVMSDKKVLKLIAFILSFCAFGFIIVGIIIYGAESVNDDYSGAFGITIVAGLIALVAGILGVVDWLKS